VLSTHKRRRLPDDTTKRYHVHLPLLELAVKTMVDNCASRIDGELLFVVHHIIPHARGVFDFVCHVSEIDVLAFMREERWKLAGTGHD
jgi:hypothetical protein